MLSSTAFAEFQGEVIRRQAMGDDLCAVRPWLSVVEMVHAPWPRSEVLRPPELPPFRWAPCMDATCERCRSFQGIQVFYGLAGGLADECWSKMGWHQLMRALAATDEKAPWWQHMGVVGPAMSWHRSLWMVLERSRYGQGFVSAPWFWRHGDVGNQAMNVGWIQGSTTLIALQSGLGWGIENSWYSSRCQPRASRGGLSSR